MLTAHHALKERPEEERIRVADPGHPERQEAEDVCKAVKERTGAVNNK